MVEPAALIREISFGAVFGASIVGEAFLIAFRLPNLLRTFFADGAVYGSVIPELAREKKKFGIKSVFKFATQIMFSLSVILLLITLIVQCFTPHILKIIVPGFVENSERWVVTLRAARIVFPYLCFFSLATMFVSILNVLGRYWVHPTVGIVLSTVTCITMYFINGLPKLQKLDYFCFSVLGSGMLLLITLWLLARRDGFRFTKLDLAYLPRIQSIAKRMITTSIATFGLHINVFIDMCSASFLPVGQLTFLLMADRINLFCVEIFGTSFGTILLPNFATMKNEPKKLIGLLEDALILAIQISIPVMIILFFTSEIVIKVLYGHGKFNDANCLASAKALSIYIFGMPAYVLIRIFMSFFFSQGRQTIAIIATSFTIVSNLVGNILLVKKMEYLGLALSTVCSMWIGVVVYFFVLFKDYENIDLKFPVLKSVLWVIIFSLTAFLVYGHCQFYPYFSFSNNLKDLFLFSASLLFIYFYFGKKLNVNHYNNMKVMN